MEIRLHNGKTMKVSEKRFKEFSALEENSPVWLEFRMKMFGYSKEELIMNPSSRILFNGKNGMLMTVHQFRGRFHGGKYAEGRLDENLFDTPQEAYDFAYNL